MNQKTIYIIFWVSIISLLSLPLIQSIHPIFNFSKLGGAYEKVDVPRISSSDWLTGGYQHNVELYIQQNFGFREPLVRLNNQIMFALYKKLIAPNIFLGKDDFLFRFYSPEYKRHTYFRGDEYLSDKIFKWSAIAKAVDSLYGCKMLLVIAPGKHYFHEDKLPEQFKSSDTLPNNYKQVKKLLAESDLSYIDLNQYFLSIKDTLSWPLYAKGGIHWTQYGAFYAMDSIFSFLNTIGDVKLDNLRYKKERKREANWPPDQDIYNTINLLKAWPDLNLKYAYLDSSELNIKPKVISIADSYYHAVDWSGIPEKYFSDDSQFWYYYKTFYNTKGKNIGKQTLRSQLSNTDYIIYLSTVMNLERLGFGFIEEAYDEIVLNKVDEEKEAELRFQKRLSYYISCIKADPDWLESVKVKAQKNNKSLDEMIRIDAEYMVRQESKADN